MRSIVLLALAVIAPAAASAQRTPTAAEIAASLTRGIHVVPAAPSVSLNVDFDSGSAVVTPAAARVLDALATALKTPALASDRFRIEGHTDTVGSDALNQALSQRRAVAVADYLAERWQIDRARLRPAGLGKAGLLVPTPDQTPEQRNRRVLVVNIAG